MPIAPTQTRFRGGGSSSIYGGGDLTTGFQKAEEQARLANLSRREQIEEIFDQIIATYGPGGTFGAGFEKQLGVQKAQDVGAVAQRDISRGLYGIRPYEQEWEATVGAGARLKLEDVRMERLSQAQSGKASFLERINEPYPDYNLLSQATAAQASAPSYDPTEARGSIANISIKQPTQREYQGTSTGLTGGAATPGEIGQYYAELEKLRDSEKQAAGGSIEGSVFGQSEAQKAAELSGAVQGVDTAATGQPPATASLITRYSKYKKGNPNYAGSYADWYFNKR